MNGIPERGEALENKFFHDEDLRFKAAARRNRMIGIWAADKLGKSGEERESYVKEVVITGLKEAGDNAIVQKILDDFKAADIIADEADLREKMARFLHEVTTELQNR